MKKARRKAKARRTHAAPPHATVGSILKRIAKVFEIPRQSIVIVNPRRQRVRANARIAWLRQAWR